MKDVNGKKLEKGDAVILRATVKDCGPSGNYENVTLETVLKRAADGACETIPAINAGLLEKVEDEPEAKAKPHHKPAKSETHAKGEKDE